MTLPTSPNPILFIYLACKWLYSIRWSRDCAASWVCLDGPLGRSIPSTRPWRTSTINLKGREPRQIERGVLLLEYSSSILFTAVTNCVHFLLVFFIFYFANGDVFSYAGTSPSRRGWDTPYHVDTGAAVQLLLLLRMVLSFKLHNTSRAVLLLSSLLPVYILLSLPSITVYIQQDLVCVCTYNTALYIQVVYAWLQQRGVYE